MKGLLVILLGIFIYLIYQVGPEFLQFNTFRIYKEIKCLQERVQNLENR